MIEYESTINALNREPFIPSGIFLEPPRWIDSSSSWLHVYGTMNSACALFRPNILLLATYIIFAGFLTATAQQPFFHYRQGGAYSSYRQVEVVIGLTGETKVTISKYEDDKNAPPLAYETQLSEYELSALQEIIVATGLREAHHADSRPVGHGGLTFISVHCDDWSNTVTFANAPALDPLSYFSHRLVTQAEIVHDIESGGNPYKAIPAVNPRTAGSGVLQPYVLKKPLIAYVKTSTNRQRLSWAFEALTWLTTPEEHLGLVAAELRKPERANVLRYVNTDGGGPDAHSEELHFIRMSFIRTNYQNCNSLSYEDKNKLEGSLSLLGTAHSMVALPLLTEVFSACQKGGLPPDNIPLHQLKRDGLAVISGFLENGNEFLREAAIHQCELAARGNPKSGYAYPYSSADFEQMRTLYKKHVLPCLHQMQANDPIPKIRHRAETAVGKIEEELKK